MAEMNRKQRRALGIPTRKQDAVHAHELVAETAKAQAHALYEKCMKENRWYAGWKARWPEATPRELEERFVALQWKNMLPAARAILAGMLNLPEHEHLKDQIAEALMLDNTLIRGRRATLEAAPQG